MEKVKESTLTVKELKEQMGKLLGVDDNLGDDVIKIMDESLMEVAEQKGEKRAEEALTLAEKAMSLIEDDEIKGILVTNMLGRLPISLQKFIIDNMKKIIVQIILTRLEKETKGDPIKGLMLMAGVIQSMEEDNE